LVELWLFGIPGGELSTVQPAGAVQTLATGDLRDVVLSPNGQVAYVSNSEGWVSGINVSTGDLVGRWKVGDQLGGMDVSPDGRYLLVTEGKIENPTGDQWSFTASIKAHRLDLTTGEIKDFVATAEGYDRGFYDVAYTSDGKAVFTQDFAGSGWVALTTLDFATGKFSESQQSFAQTGVLSPSADHSIILLAPQNISDAPLFTYNSGKGITASHQNYQDNVSGYNSGIQAISPGGGMIAQYIGQIHIYDSNLKYLTNVTNIHTDLPGSVYGLDFSNDGKYLYVLDGSKDRVLELSTSDWAITRSISLGVDVRSATYGNAGAYGDRLSLSADGSHLVILADGAVVSVNLASIIPDGGTDGPDVLQGGVSDDKLDGLGGNDRLDGGAGADTLLGGEGNDTLVGGEGHDVLDGQGGASDWAEYLSATSSVIVDLTSTSSQAAGGGGSDRLSNIENVRGSAFADKLTGDAQANILDGSAGADTLSGGAGGDTLLAGMDNDLLLGQGGDDSLDGGAGFDIASYEGAVSAVTVDLALTTVQNVRGDGFDTLINIEGLKGSQFNDTLKGDIQANSLIGGAGADFIDGGDGNDTLLGDAGDDIVWGGLGQDYAIGGDGFDQINGNQGNDTAYGGEGGDWVVGGKDNDLLYGDSGDDIVYGNLGNDTCYGGDGADWVRGGQGDDVIDGGAGNDWMAGDRGNDTVTGGAGADIFYFFAGAAIDRVTDFSSAAGDRVLLDAGQTYTLSFTGEGAVIALGAGDQMILIGITQASIGDWLQI